MFAPLAAVVFLALAWSCYWWFAAAAVRAAVATQRGDLEREGWVLACSEEWWAGYPFRFEFVCKSPDLRQAGSSILHTGRLHAVAQAYNPWHILLLVDGPTTLVSTPGKHLGIKHQRVLASLRIKDTVEPQISIEVPEPQVEDVGTAASILLHLRHRKDGAWDLAASAAAIHLQSPGQEPLDIGQADLAATLLPTQRLRVESLALSEAGVTWSGQGEVWMDQQRQIAGTLHTKTNSIDGLLAVLSPYFQLTQQEQAAFKSVLGLLGQQTAADITAEDGDLYVGPIRIAKLSPLY